MTPDKTFDERLRTLVVDYAHLYKKWVAGNVLTQQDLDSALMDTITAIKQAIKDRRPEAKPLLKMSTDYRYGKATQHSIWCYNQALSEWSKEMGIG